MKTILKDFEYIRKRNGSVVKFDSSRITKAISKAGKATGEFDEQIAWQLTTRVLAMAHELISEPLPSVEQIQDIVEQVLLLSPYKKTAKAYIIYREQHARIREIISQFNVDIVDNYLEKKDWQVNENSNMAYSLQGLNNYISSEISKIYWLNKIYPQEIKLAHNNCILHIHDLNALSVYCVGWNLYDLLVEGFKGVCGKVEAKPAKHFHTALGQVVNFFYTLQGEAAGAQAFSNFDTLLAPFIYYDKLSFSEVKQALQEFMFNMNVPTRVGFQTPFTNITFDLTVPKYLADQPVVIGGKLQDKSYKEFTKQIELFNQAFLEVMLEGDAKGRPFTFPIPTYNISQDFNWEDKLLDLLWEVTAKYGIPYFANFINSNMKPEDVRSMCCRLRINNKELYKRGGGLFGASPLTGSIGVVTINMPRIGLLANSESDYFHQLENIMVVCKNSLEIKRKVLEAMTRKGLYPYTKFYLRNIYEKFGCFWKNHFSTIGLVGMNESCINFLGEGIYSDIGKKFAIKVLKFMNEKLIEFQKETGNNYNLEATPAEGTSYRFAEADKKLFSNAVFANSKKDEDFIPYYTNSTQLPVGYTDDVFEILDLQDELQIQYTGGTVQHIFLGEKVDDSKAIKNFVRKVFNKYKLPYISITPTFSICPNCGYIRGEVEICPNCLKECEVYSRVVGYLRPVKQWNKGKQEEFKDRKKVSL